MLLPTVRATPLVAPALFSASPPVAPCRPPKVALASVPKLSAPLPLASKVLIERAAVLASSSVPPLTSVVPVKLLEAERVRIPPAKVEFSVSPAVFELFKAPAKVVLVPLASMEIGPVLLMIGFWVE